MQKIKVNIQITIKADISDDDEIKQAIFDKLGELIEAEELDWDLVDEDEDDEEY